MYKLSYILLSLVALLGVACHDTQRSVEFRDEEGSLWRDAEEFYFDNQDSLSRRDISIVVRYDGSCDVDSIALKVLTISPDSMLYEEPFTLRIPRLADMRPQEHTFPYRSNVLLRQKGNYYFRITPSEPAEGIASVGLIITDN